MPPSKQDLEFQRRIDELRAVLKKRGVNPDEQRGRVKLAQCLAVIAGSTENAA